MANTRSARKRIRANERRRIRNRAVRSAVRTKIARARRALLGDTAATEADLRDAIRALDRAAEKGILHRNNAKRRKSRLASMAARLSRAAGGEAGEQAAARSVATGGAKGRAKTSGRKAAATSSGAQAKRSSSASATASTSAAKSPAKSAAKGAARTGRGGRSSSRSS